MGGRGKVTGRPWGHGFAEGEGERGSQWRRRPCAPPGPRASCPGPAVLGRPVPCPHAGAPSAGSAGPVRPPGGQGRPWSRVLTRSRARCRRRERSVACRGPGCAWSECHSPGEWPALGALALDAPCGRLCPSSPVSAREEAAVFRGRSPGPGPWVSVARGTEPVGTSRLVCHVSVFPQLCWRVRTRRAGEPARV